MSSKRKTCTILSVGNELTEGKTVDTNSAWLSTELSGLGFMITGHRTVPDEAELLNSVLKSEADTETDLVVITGGLGPTVDDLTREVIAETFSIPLEYDERAWELLVKRFKSFGKTPSENNRKQAMIPEGASPYYNTCGTASGFGLRVNSTNFCVMPGIPREMKAMYRESLVPYIHDNFEVDDPPLERCFKTFGIGESDAGNRLSDLMERGRDPRVDMTVNEGVITVKLTASPDLQKQFEKDAAVIREHLSNNIWIEEDISLEEHILNLFKENNLTLALAESCTGGMIAADLVGIPGSSETLIESIVCYSNSSKINRLGVSEKTIEMHGAVSKETVEEMAEGLRRSSGADVTAAVTGIAGPGGGTDEKPVGLVWFAVSADGYLKSASRNFTGDRDQVRTRSVSNALWMIREFLIKQ